MLQAFKVNQVHNINMPSQNFQLKWQPRANSFNIQEHNIVTVSWNPITIQTEGKQTEE
jgi:hypothetical protein